MAKNTPNLMKNITLHIQEVQQKAKEKSTPRPNTVKLVKHKDKNFKVLRKTVGSINIINISFSSEIAEDR